MNTSSGQIHSGDPIQRSSRLSHARQIDSICDAFESSWKAGRPPELSDFLQGTDLPASTLFVELVLIDISYRQQGGEAPTLQEYAERFPHFQDALAGVTIPESAEVGDSFSLNPDPRQRIGKFELTERLGGGTFGIVWKAWDEQLHRWVAIKQFRDEFFDMSSVLLLREAKAVAQIDHPNVVRVHEIGQYAGQHYAAFEYVSGGTLANWLKLQPATRGKIQIPAREAAEIILQIAQGLQAVHENDVVHRDLKPGNILRTPQGTLKIADFGLARRANLLATIGGDGILLGTVPYMSPEQCNGGQCNGKEVTCRSDLYSCGVLLYEILTGVRPFRGSQSEILSGIQKLSPEPPGKLADVPVSLENICLRAMEKEPDDRYQSAAELQRDLEAFLRGETVERRTASTWTRARRQIRRHWFTAVPILCMLIGLGALAFAQVQVPADGKKTVTLTSEPTGAKVAFIPLNPRTGRPLPEKILHAPGTTPITARILPGEYLVEVYMDGDNGDFHEVYRHVPTDEELLPSADSYHVWRRDTDDPDLITLPKVRIPSKRVLEGMVPVPGNQQFQVGIEGDRILTPHLRSVPGFYMDPTEVPLSAYQETFQKAGDPDRRWQAPPGSDYALTTSWSKAVGLIELLGKRLPDEFEYELAATQNGTRKYPWGDEPRREDLDEIAFQPVGFPRFDRVDFSAPIYGLGSNVAEWTISHSISSYPRKGLDLEEHTILPVNPTLRAIRGGGKEVISGSATVIAGERNPRSRSVEPVYTMKPGLGFRGVRSLRPRLTPEDFGNVLPSESSK